MGKIETLRERADGIANGRGHCGGITIVDVALGMGIEVKKRLARGLGLLQPADLPECIPVGCRQDAGVQIDLLGMAVGHLRQVVGQIDNITIDLTPPEIGFYGLGVVFHIVGKNVDGFAFVYDARVGGEVLTVLQKLRTITVDTAHLKVRKAVTAHTLPYALYHLA